MPQQWTCWEAVPALDPSNASAPSDLAYRCHLTSFALVGWPTSESAARKTELRIDGSAARATPLFVTVRRSTDDHQLWTGNSEKNVSG